MCIRDLRRRCLRGTPEERYRYSLWSCQSRSLIGRAGQGIQACRIHQVDQRHQRWEIRGQMEDITVKGIHAMMVQQYFVWKLRSFRLFARAVLRLSWSSIASFGGSSWSVERRECHGTDHKSIGWAYSWLRWCGREKTKFHTISCGAGEEDGTLFILKTWLYLQVLDMVVSTSTSYQDYFSWPSCVLSQMASTTLHVSKRIESVTTGWKKIIYIQARP